MVLDFKAINEELRDRSPEDIVTWALTQGQRPVVTTNFGPYETTILHLCTQVKPEMSVIWCDSGYGTPATYRHVEALKEALGLNLFPYVPGQSAAHWDAVMGGIPGIDDPKHERFTEIVKLEPFKRALSEHTPDVWFTNIRRDQTAFRATLDIVTDGGDGMIRVSPFFYWSDEQMDAYLAEHGLTTEHDYYDPTKVLEHRECGLHLREAH